MRLAALITTLLLVAACGDRKPAAAAPADAAPATSSEVGPIGVESCDAYLDKMSRCLGRLAADAQETMRRAMDETRRGWRKATATAEGKATLATACQQALEAGKAAAQAMGCEW